MDSKIQRDHADWTEKVKDQHWYSDEVPLTSNVDLDPLVNSKLRIWPGSIKRAADDDTIDFPYEGIEIPQCVGILFRGDMAYAGVGYA